MDLDHVVEIGEDGEILSVHGLEVRAGFFLAFWKKKQYNKVKIFLNVR